MAFFIEDMTMFKAVKFIETILKGGKDLANAISISARYYQIAQQDLEKIYTLYVNSLEQNR